jgi:hypothetical protein
VISASRTANPESRDEVKCAKCRDFRPNLPVLGAPGRTPECVAEAGGFELRNGELEIRPSRLSERSGRTSFR